MDEAAPNPAFVRITTQVVITTEVSGPLQAIELAVAIEQDMDGQPLESVLKKQHLWPCEKDIRPSGTTLFILWLVAVTSQLDLLQLFSLKSENPHGPVFPKVVDPGLHASDNRSPRSRPAAERTPAKPF